jgi:Carbamoyltransferase C-terminus
MAAVAGLLALYYVMALTAVSKKSMTFDEMAHLTGGYTYLGLQRLPAAPRERQLAAATRRAAGGDDRSLVSAARSTRLDWIERLCAGRQVPVLQRQRCRHPPESGSKLSGPILAPIAIGMLVVRLLGSKPLTVGFRGRSVVFTGRARQFAIVLNTSFSVKGEPIVCSPDEAVRCFLKTEIDYLVLGDRICSR